MLLCIDVGNTNTVLGLTKENQILNHWRIRTETKTTSDEFGMVINSLFQTANIKLEDVKGLIISCVVPPLLNVLEDFTLRYLKIKPVIVNSDLNTGMPIRYDDPKEVGADRIVNAVGAYEKYQTTMIIVDFGTATTFDYVSKQGEYIGGAIAPGALTASEALFRKAAKLPRVEIFTPPPTVIARDTLSSMNVGIIYGYAGLVDGIVSRMKKETTEDLMVIATGGLAPLIFDFTETLDRVDESLTLSGLMTIYKRICP